MGRGRWPREGEGGEAGSLKEEEEGGAVFKGVTKGL